MREQDARISKMVHTPTFLVVAGALPGLFAATSLENGLDDRFGYRRCDCGHGLDRALCAPSPARGRAPR
ncbi:MAG: hypothetical protein ACLTSX_11970 [Collinsella sp.]